MAKQDVELQFRLIDGVTKSLTSIQKGVTGLGASIISVNQAAELTSKAFGAIGAAAGAIGGAVQGAANVEDALVRVADITKATAEEQAALQKAVRDSVDTTRFSAEEAAGALVLLSEDGFSASQAVEQLGTVLQYAQANALSAADATNALGGVLDTYSEKPEIIGELADKLTAVSRAAGVGAKSLQDGLVAIGVTAEQANIPLNDAIGYLGLLATKGLEGAKGVKSLTTVIRDIQDPASKAGKALEDLGIDGADFGQVLARLGNDSAATEKVLLAFTGKSRDALKALLTQGGGDLGQFAQVMDEAAGASKRASDVLNDTFNGALARIQNQLAQTRNALLEPLLAPLADEMQALSTRLADFAKTEDFKAIVDKFAEISTEGIKYVSALIENFDFTEAAARTIEFANVVSENLGRIQAAFETASNTTSVFVDALKVGFNAAVVAVAGTLGELSEAIGFFSDDAADLALSLKDIAERAREDTGKAVADLADSMKRAGKSAESFADGTEDIRRRAIAVVAPLDAFGNKLDDIGGGLADADGATKPFVLNLRDLEPAARAAAGGISRTAAAADDGAQSIDSLQRELRRVREELDKAPLGSAEFVKLAEQAKELEEKVKAARAEIEGIADSGDKAAGGSSNLTQSMNQQANAADNAANSSDNLSNSTNGATASFDASKAAIQGITIALGNLTQAYVDSAVEQASSARSMSEFADILNALLAAGERENTAVEQAIERRKRQIDGLSEESHIRRRLIQIYGESSANLEELVQLELRAAQAKKEKNNETEREIELEEKKNAGIAAALGLALRSSEGPVSTGGKNGGGNASRGGDVVNNITINQNGFNPENVQESVDLIERELSRRDYLRR